MDEVFISYRRSDEHHASQLAKALEDQGLSVWWDKEIPPGKSFDQVIEEALDAAKCVVVLWSKRANQSDWVKTEAGEGAARGILMPVLVERVQPPLAFRRLEAADLVSWDGSQDDREFVQLVRAIRSLVGTQSAPKTSPSAAGPAADVEPPHSPPPATPTPPPTAPPAAEVHQPAYVAQPARPEKKTWRWGLIAVLGGFAAFVGALGIAGIFFALGISRSDNYEDVPAVSQQADEFGTYVGQLAERLDDEERPDGADRGDVTLRYTGDIFNCTLGIVVQVGDRTFRPTSNPYILSGITTGYSDYQISGTISCPGYGQCVASGYGSVEAYDGALFDVVWTPSYTQCNVSLIQADGKF